MHKYPYFIPENSAPYGARRIIVENEAGEEIVRLPLGKLALPALGNKKYSFGTLSDVHVTNSTFAMNQFKKALSFFGNTENVDFVCISGDLTSSGKIDQFESYRDAVAASAVSIPVYVCTGNHDVQEPTVAPFLAKESTQPYTGSDLYYSFTQGNDLFIMFGMSGWISKTGDIFTTDALQWLYETLEANRNKRCFIFEHCPSMVYANSVVVKEDGSGKPYNQSTSGAILGVRLPTGNLLNQGSTSQPFRELMAHYKNVVWFHGHSHMDFKYQEDCAQVNYDKNFGCHSIHIPSSASGRSLKADGSGWENPVGSYGYVVDVYEKYIVLRGCDFVAEKFVPIATYCLDTTLQTVEANTFTDSTGTITT
jgi:Icc-related predicted phosphoesterase